MCGEKLKEITLKTLDKLSFDLEILALKLVDITTEMSRKTSPKTSSKSYLKQPPKAPIYRARKLAVGSQNDLSVDRPVDRPTVRFLTVEPAVDRPGRPRPGYRKQALCPVDRPDRPLPGTENRVLCRSTGAFQRAEALWRSTDPVDRPSSQAGVHVCACRSTDSVDRLGRPTSSSVDRSGRPTEAMSGQLRDLKC